MTKKEFLKEIRFHLERAYLGLNPIEIEDIMRDYDEYFREGNLEGKSEIELVESLGNPKEIVDEMVKNDIEDKKYRKEDFDEYFQGEKKEKTMNIGDTIKKGGKGIDFLGKKFLKIIAVLAIGIIDLMYFPTLVVGAVAAIISTVAIFIFLPTAASIFSIIGQNTLTLFFPILFAIGLVVLEIMLLVFLLKLGYKVNRKIFFKLFNR